VSTLAEQLLSPFHQGEQRTLSHHALRTCVAVGEGASTTSAQGYALNRVSHFMDAGDKTYESASVPIDRSVAAVTEDLPEEERELLELLEELVREPTPGRARSCRRRGSCTGRIQLVVATPRDGGGAGWVLASVRRRFMGCVARCGRRGGRRSRGARTGFAFGNRSPAVRRVRMRLLQPGCRRRSGQGGFVRLAGCRQSRWLRCRSGICRLPSGKRSRSSTPSASGCGRSLAGWVDPRRRSRGSCAATRPLAATRSCIGQRRRSGMRSDAPAARRSPSLPRTKRCVSTCRTALPARSRGPAAPQCRAMRCAGSVVATVAVKTGALGEIVESRADREPAPDRLPR